MSETKFDPFPYENQADSIKWVRHILRFDEYDLQSPVYSSLPALYELAADPKYKNLPISPAYILQFGDTRGEAAAVLAMGATDNYVVTVCDPVLCFNGLQFRDAYLLYACLGVSDSIVSVVAGSDIFDYTVGGGARLVYFHGWRKLCQKTRTWDDTELDIELAMEIEIAMGKQDCAMASHVENWFCFSGYGEFDTVTRVVDKMLTEWPELFRSCYLTGNLAVCGYVGGFDSRKHRLDV